MSKLTPVERIQLDTFAQQAERKHCPGGALLRSQIDLSVLRELVLRVVALEGELVRLKGAARPTQPPVIGKCVMLRNGMGPLGPVLGPSESGDHGHLRVITQQGTVVDWDRNGACARYGGKCGDEFDVVEVVETTGGES